MTVTLHTDTEVDQAWRALDELHTQLPHHPVVSGARAAAEWTTGRTATAPMTNTARPSEGDAAAHEGVLASLVVVGREPGDPAFAAGVMAWLDWIVGLQPLPRWLR